MNDLTRRIGLLGTLLVLFLVTSSSTRSRHGHNDGLES